VERSQAPRYEGGPRIRAAAAEARLALLGLHRKKLNVPVDHLAVSKGIVTVVDKPNRSVTLANSWAVRRGVPFTGKAPLSGE